MLVGAQKETGEKQDIKTPVTKEEISIITKTNFPPKFDSKLGPRSNIKINDENN